MKFDEIKKIKHGPVDLRRILPGSFAQTVEEFKRVDGVAIKLDDKTKSKENWVLTSKLKIEIYLKNEGVLRYTFERGWVTDLASVPKKLRSFVDNDDYYILLAALVHDANFENKILSFKQSNVLFYKMIRHSGAGWWLATKAFIGVHNWIGKRVYNSERNSYNKKYKRLKFSWDAK